MFKSRILVAVIAVLFVSGAAAFAQNSPAQPQAAETSAPMPEMGLGDPKAPVTVIEYSSLACPSCASFHKNVLPKLKSEFIDKGKVRYIMKEFPHNDAAFGGAVVARCLEPSRFFSFIELLFEKQSEWAFKDDALTPLKDFAKQAGMPEEQFNKCIANENLQNKVLAVRSEGVKKGVRGTPAIYVNGVALRGNPTYDKVVQAIKPYLGS